jgi:hypothetical protein
MLYDMSRQLVGNEIIDRFCGLDARSMKAPHVLALEMYDVGDEISRVIDAQIAAGGVVIDPEDKQSAPETEYTLGFGERQVFCGTRLAFDYGVSARLTRHSRLDATADEAYICVPSAKYLDKFFETGTMEFLGYYALMGKTRKYEPFGSGQPVEVRMYATLLQKLIPAIVDPRKVGLPLVWDSPLPSWQTGNQNA